MGWGGKLNGSWDTRVRGRGLNYISIAEFIAKPVKLSSYRTASSTTPIAMCPMLLGSTLTDYGCRNTTHLLLLLLLLFSAFPLLSLPSAFVCLSRPSRLLLLLFVCYSPFPLLCFSASLLFLLRFSAPPPSCFSTSSLFSTLILPVSSC